MNAASYPQPTFRLDGKRALITGGSKGLGLAAAWAMAQAGAHVAITARGLDAAQAAAAAINAAGFSAEAWALDVTDSEQVSREIAQREPFQLLLNNAGAARNKLITDTSDTDFSEIMDLNVKGAFFVLREMARKLIAAQQSGSFINISSQMGHVGGPKRTVYSASKHALEGMTKTLAWELGPHGIRVNSIAPTFIETELTKPFFQDPAFKASALSKLAIGRIGQPQEIMGAVLFLASDASSLVTGASLLLDGGWTAQ